MWPLQRLGGQSLKQPIVPIVHLKLGPGSGRIPAKLYQSQRAADEIRLSERLGIKPCVSKSGCRASALISIASVHHFASDGLNIYKLDFPSQYLHDDHRADSNVNPVDQRQENHWLENWLKLMIT